MKQQKNLTLPSTPYDISYGRANKYNFVTNQTSVRENKCFTILEAIGNQTRGPCQHEKETNLLKGHKFQEGEEERFLSICTKETLKPLELGEYLSRWSISYCTSWNGRYFSYRHQLVQETLLKRTSKNFGLYRGVSDVLAGFMCFGHKNPSRLVFIFYTDLTFFSVLSLDLSISSSLERCCCSFSFFFFFLVLSLSFSLCFFCCFLLPNAF